jgi:hypothetical protein
MFRVDRAVLSTVCKGTTGGTAPCYFNGEEHCRLKLGIVKAGAQQRRETRRRCCCRNSAHCLNDPRRERRIVYSEIIMERRVSKPLVISRYLTDPYRDILAEPLCATMGPFLAKVARRLVQTNYIITLLALQYRTMDLSQR